MKIEEAISKVKQYRATGILSHDANEGINKLLEVAEQVERVRGIEDKVINPSICPTAQDFSDEDHNTLNSQWRALIVGRADKVGTIINKDNLLECFDGDILTVDYEKIEGISTAIRNLFLGESK